MKKILIGVLLFANMLFADFNSLADEQAYKNEQAKQEEAKKQARMRQFNEKILPRIKNLEVLNGLFYKKYLVKNEDTPEMIDEKFKQRRQLYSEMAHNYKILEAEYKILNETAYFHSIDVSSINFVRIERDGYLPIYDFDPTKNGGFEAYENYLRNAYQTYEERQKTAKEIKDREIANEKMKRESEALSKAIAEKRKKMAPACQKWRNEANKQVYSLGVGDKIISSNGAVYTIAGINANTFTVVSPMTNTYLYLQKNSCLPYGALRSAPSPLCYQ